MSGGGAAAPAGDEVPGLGVRPMKWGYGCRAVWVEPLRSRGNGLGLLLNHGAVFFLFFVFFDFGR